MTKILPNGICRRRLLSGGAALIALSPLPAMAQATPLADASLVRGLAFDGDDLLLVASDIWRSADGGANWQRAAQTSPGQVSALASHPARPGRIYATLASGGVIRSEDGGRSWSQSGTGLPQGPADALTIAAHDPDTLYVALRGDGLWRSQDGGKAWEFVMDRPYEDGSERDILSLISVNSPTGMGGIWLYAGTDTGLTRVPDCFCRWQAVQSGDAMDALVAGVEPAPDKPLPAGAQVYSLALAIAAPDVIYAALSSDLWKSTDAGVNWAQIAEMPMAQLAVHPTNPDHVIAVNDDTILLSRDSGLTWSATSHNFRRTT